MPSDANGVYSLPDGYLAETGELVLASQHNLPLEDLAEAMSGRLPTSGAAAMKGPLKAAVGAADKPSLTFSSDTTSGLFKTATGVGVSIGGTIVAEFTSAGLSKGARYLGELIPYTGSTVQQRTVFPYGQTLSRTTYPDLWAFAQIEIAAGNVFYNNGNGLDTFGIGDCRGRSLAGKDDMGGVAASRLTATYFGASGSIIGSVGGGESSQMQPTNLPFTAYNLNGAATTINVTSTRSDIALLPGGWVANSNYSQGPFSFAYATPGGAFTGAVNSSGGYTPQGSIGPLGNSTPLRTVGPRIICNFLLYAGA